MQSGSTRARSAAPGRAFWCRKAWPTGSTPAESRMDGLRIGDPLDKCIDIGAIVDPIQLQTITEMVDASEGQKYRAATPCRRAASTPPPSSPASPPPAPDAGRNLRPGAGVDDLPHPAEAVELANNTRYGLAASVWSENINLALDVAPKLRAGVVWVNGTNMFDAAAGFGGVRESGFGREGGWEGLMAYLKPAAKARPLKPFPPSPRPPTRRPRHGPHRQAVHRRQAGPPRRRPFPAPSLVAEGPSPWPHRLANRKDARNAVEAAQAAERLGPLYRPRPRPDPLLHRREPLGPRRRIRQPHPGHDRQPGQSEVEPPSSAFSPMPPGPTNTKAPPSPCRCAASRLPFPKPSA